MLKLSDTQLALLTAAAQRDDHLIHRPEHLKGGAAQKVATKLLALGLAEEVRGGSNQPGWRTGEDGAGIGLRITAAGLEALGLTAETDESRACSEIAEDPEARSGPARDRAGPRPGSKQALVVSLLARVGGANLDQLVAATGWLPHTTRAALTGLRQRGHVILKSKDEHGRTVYRIDPGEGRAGDGAGLAQA